MTNKAIVGGFIGLLAEIATSDCRLDEAETLLQQALALSKDHSPYANCAARLALLRGQVDVATRYLNIASAGYRKNHRPPLPTIMVYGHGWWRFKVKLALIRAKLRQR